MRRGEGRLSVYGKMKGAGLALVLVGSPVVAADYACKPWAAPHQGMPPVTAVSVGRSLMTYKGVSGPTVSVRMMYGGLTRRVYPEDEALFVIHGDFVRGADRPEFGPRITLQRLVHDATNPILAITTCEASQ